MKYPVHFKIEFKKNPYPGKFIAIEGIDGSGKTTQAQLLCKKLEERGVSAYCTKEPTDEPTGKMIRKVLAGELFMPPVALQYLFNADRVVHQEQFITHLEKGEYIITDRFFWSSVAYAIADLHKVDDYYLTVFSLLSFYNQFIVPDITFYLKISPEVAIDRIRKTSKRQEIYDNLEKLQNIEKGYAFLIKKFPKKFVIVDSDVNIKKVTDEILSHLSTLGYLDDLPE